MHQAEQHPAAYDPEQLLLWVPSYDGSWPDEGKARHREQQHGLQAQTELHTATAGLAEKTAATNNGWCCHLAVSEQ